MYAIIQTGGKQYKVAAGDTIVVEKLPGEVGSAIKFDKVLVILNGDKSKFGAPLVKGASVTGKIAGDWKNKKLVVYKYKSKKGFHKKRGHRQPMTRVTIEKITG
jgi:large subunit ribosomal protein L21